MVRAALALVAATATAPLGAQPVAATASGGSRAEPLGVSALNASLRAGDTVTVAGRASVDAGTLHDRALLISLQDGRSGIWVYRRAPKRGEPSVVPPVLEGDSVVATGTLNVYRGSLELFASRVAVVPGGRRVPTVDSTWPAPPLREGRLVRVRATAGVQGYSEGGRFLRLHREGSTDSLTLWIPSAHTDAPDVDHIRDGDRLDVTGLTAVYRDNVDDPAVTQIVPRHAADVHTIGIPHFVYELALRGVIVLAAVAVLVLLAARVMTRRHARALREADARYRQLLALCPDAVIVHDGECVLFANPAAARLLGARDERALAGRAVATFVGAEEREALAAAGAAPSANVALASPAGPPIGRRIRTSFVTDDGALVDVEASTSACRYLDRDAAVVVARDIGPQLRYERELRELALLDDLTGLHNRRGFFMFAEAELRRLRERGSSAVLVFADLDGLKEINDRNGHAAGDSALRAVARAMREVVGAQGLTARWSGDEFVALIPDLAASDTPADESAPDAAAAEAFDQRLRASLGRHVAPQSAFKVSASVGARRLGPDASETLATALAAADAGLYRRRGRSRTASGS